MFKRRTTRSTTNSRRLGAATVELAVCLPVLVTIVFGSIQASNLIYLKQAVTTAAYEGSLELSKTDATSESVIARATQFLVARGILEGVVTLNPSNEDIANIAPGETITIRVSAPTNSNLMLRGFFSVSSGVTAELVASR